MLGWEVYLLFQAGYSVKVLLIRSSEQQLKGDQRTMHADIESEGFPQTEQ